MKGPRSSCKERPPKSWVKGALTSTITALAPLHRRRLPTTSLSKLARNSICSSARKSAGNNPLVVSLRPAALPAKLKDFRHQRPDCPRAMTEDRLDRRTQLAKRLVVLGNLKQRVISKATCSGFGEENPAAANIFRLCADISLGI